MKKTIIYSLIFVLIFSSCKKEGLDTWNSNGRVWFTSVSDVVAQFKKLPETTENLTVEIPLSFAGKIEKFDREVNIEITKDKRNQLTSYEIVKPILILSGNTSGILKIKINKTENLLQSADTVNLSLLTSKDLEIGPQNNSKCRLIIVNKYIKPWWWYDYQCGIYSEQKHQVLFTVLNSDDDIRGVDSDPVVSRNWTKATSLYNLYLLNKYCVEQGFTFRFANGK